MKQKQHLSKDNREKLEELEYRKQLVGSHGFKFGEYEKITSMKKDELRRKLEEI
jgi:hypothetical protein